MCRYLILSSVEQDRVDVVGQVGEASGDLVHELLKSVRTSHSVHAEQTGVAKQQR